MASVSIVISDAEEKLGLNLQFDPPIQGDSIPTEAQRIAIELFGRLVEQLKSEQAEEWQRDEERTYTTLLLVGGYDVPHDAISSWSDEECMQAEEWATALHYYASDNDDVEVPPVPSWVAHWTTDSPITI